MVVDNYFWMTRNGRFIGFNQLQHKRSGRNNGPLAGLCPGHMPRRDVGMYVIDKARIDRQQRNCDDSRSRIIDSVSEDGRYALFRAQSGNIMPGKVTEGFTHLYLRDTCFGVASGCTPNTVLAI